LSIVFEHTLLADAAALPTVRRGVTDALQRHGVNSDELRADVSLALTEALTNAILHAYPDDDTVCTIAVTVEQTAKTIVISVTDTGVGVSEPSGTRGLGLGLRLIQQLTTTWSVSSTPTTGTTITMRFPIPGTSPRHRRGPRRADDSRRPRRTAAAGAASSDDQAAAVPPHDRQPVSR
jgi:anti-sigma regulatory factor (Ser/Thr protein kinase)